MKVMVMAKEWQLDARKVPDEVMNYLRKIAVTAVVEKGYSPEEVIDLLGLSRSCIYTWLRRYHAEGMAELLKARFGVPVSGRTVSVYLRRLGLSYQKPCYRAVEQQADEVAFFLDEKFPRIQRLAEKMGAEIAFEDEAGVGLRTHSGRTWGLEGHTPEVAVSDQRGGYNVLSTVTAEGQMRYSLASLQADTKRIISFFHLPETKYAAVDV